MKKFLVLLLTFSLVLTVFASCKKEADGTEAAKTTQSAKETEAPAAPSEGDATEPAATEPEIVKKDINANLDGTWKATIDLGKITSPALEGTVDIYIDFQGETFTRRVEDNLDEKIAAATVEFIKKTAESMGTTPEAYLQAEGMTEAELKESVLSELSGAFEAQSGEWYYDGTNIHLGSVALPIVVKDATELRINAYGDTSAVPFIKQ